MRENRIIVLPVLVWRTGFLGHTDYELHKCTYIGGRKGVVDSREGKAVHGTETYFGKTAWSRSS